MKYSSNLTILLLFTLLLGCSSGDDSETYNQNNNEELPSITSLSAINIGSTSARLGGVISNDSGSNFYNRGVCWSTNPNPSLSDNYEFSDGNGNGEFYIDLINLMPNTTYNARAFVTNGLDSDYGQNILFTTGEIASFDLVIPKNIITTRADLRATISGNDLAVSERGFVLNTSPNPTIDHIQIDDGNSGPGEYGGQVSNLEINTTYYLRSYAYVSLSGTSIINQLIYSEDEYSFTTTGYFGPAGGYVVYDKGEESDGWRYYEAAPTTSEFNSRWGCSGAFVSNTFTEVGKGYDNTQVILANCSDTNCAARKCANYSFGGFNDWFLTSREGTVVVIRSLVDLNALPDPNEIWTSTQTTGTNAYVQSYQDNNDTIIQEIRSKGLTYTIIPVRRY